LFVRLVCGWFAIRLQLDMRRAHDLLIARPPE